MVTPVSWHWGGLGHKGASELSLGRQGERVLTGEQAFWEGAGEQEQERELPLRTLPARLKAFRQGEASQVCGTTREAVC